jgi:hypothetical protein
MIYDDSLRTLSRRALAEYGNDDIAYIKESLIEGAPVFAVHSADGTELATFEERDIAIAVAIQNELVPVSVH